MKFKNQTVLITDPCYFINYNEGITSDDWEFSSYGDNLEALGIHNYLKTNSGDGIWNLYRCDDPNAIIEEFYDRIEHPYYIDEICGKLDSMNKEFSADSGVIGVFDLGEVLSYNPFFRDELPERCYAILEDFTGEIDIEEIREDFIVIKGIGSTNFITL